MSLFWLLSSLVGLAFISYWIGRKRALSVVNGRIKELHSLPIYSGLFTGGVAFLAGTSVLVVWLIAQNIVLGKFVDRSMASNSSEVSIEITRTQNDVYRIADGLDRAVNEGLLERFASFEIEGTPADLRERLGSFGIVLGQAVQADIMSTAQTLRTYRSSSQYWMTLFSIGAAIAGLFFAIRNLGKDFRARNKVEFAVKLCLMFSASIAIFSTAGIVFSMIFEARNFFSLYPFTQFFFGSTWAPNFRGDSDLGILPLLWGTLYICFISMLFAVPVGLFSAIYLSEYASPKTRMIAKPMIEILAGIPTIVYGLFALITVGPLLRDYFAQPLGLGESSASVMTAGLVMGVMLIPFVSSLSDDVLNAVPQSLRDASLAMGATRSETIRQVVVPAALPGIAGAILLATSRAIGETMIVVMGAGAAAKLSLNPFEAMTTVTVKIVSQLTGDADFASPETLVAFALGLTLFTITLGLNVLALYIVRKYREQYE